MTDTTDFEEINEAKANLDHIYNQPDPRAYFRALKKLDYAIPGHAKPIFQKLIDRRRQARETVRVLDLGCSYGVNAALLKYDLSLTSLYDHWGRDSLRGASSKQVAAEDRRFFGDLDEPGDIEVIGLDQAESAITYAEETGLLDGGLAVNLESEPLPEAARPALASVDLVTSTGCVGYVTETSFNQLLPAVTQGRAPWLGNFVLRLFPFEPIETALSEWGYVTEKLEGQTFVQRRFESAEEQAGVLEQLEGQGIDPTGQEADGHLVAEFYLSRPAGEAAGEPVGQLLTG